MSSAFWQSFITVYQNLNKVNYAVFIYKRNYEQYQLAIILFFFQVKTLWWRSNCEHDHSDMTRRQHLFGLWNDFSTFTVPKNAFLCGLLSGIRVEVTVFTDDANVLVFPSSGKLHWFCLHVENIWTSSA